MKILFIAALLGISHVGFCQSKNYKKILLTGKIEGTGNSKMYVGVINELYVMPSIVDSFSCVNDSFYYMSKIPAGINLCCLQNQMGRLTFIGDTNKIVFNGKSLYSVSIRGSESNRKYSAYNEKCQQIASLFAPITTAGVKAYQDKDTMLMKRYSKQYDSLMVIKNNIPVNFIRENYNNYASAVVLHSYAYEAAVLYRSSSDFYKIKDLYSLLDKNVQNSNIGKNVKVKLISLENSSVGRKFVDCELLGLDGTKFKISSLKGKYFLIEFWSSWCVGCRQELPFLKEALEKYKHNGFNILSISLENSKKKWISTVEQLHMPGLNAYHLNDDSNNALTPFESEVAKSYSVEALPSNFLVNPDGVIIATDLRQEILIKKLDEIYK